MEMFTPLFIVLVHLYSAYSLNNGLALTPPMGWMSWERFRCITDCKKFPDECIRLNRPILEPQILPHCWYLQTTRIPQITQSKAFTKCMNLIYSEQLIKRIADKMASDGYLEAGYQYVIIDDCWAAKSRDSNNKLQADPERFPSGIKALADYVHNLGLKLGIYGDYGTLTCGGYPGSIDHLQLDAQTIAEWGVDYLKLDGCYADEEYMEEGYAQMAHYLNATGRPIVFSCSFPAYKGLTANYTMAVDHCNLWRNYGDIGDSWQDVQDIATWFALNQWFLRQFAGPGHWNDPDMLIIGNFGLSFEQSQSQMTIWSILAAPLLMSVDLNTIGPIFKSILLNKDAIRINQDPLGIPGQLISYENNITVWSKPLLGTNTFQELALGVVSYRTDGYYYPHDIPLAKLFSEGESFRVKTVFGENRALDGKVFSLSENISVRVPPTGAVLLIISSF